MKKKIIILIIVCALSFQTGKAVAGVLNSYVQTTGTLSDIIRPRFYIGSAGIEELLFDEKPEVCAAFGFQNDYTRTFKTKENLDGLDLTFLPKVKFSIRARTDNPEPQSLDLKFGYIDINGNPINIAFGNVEVTDTMTNYTTQLISCLERPQNIKHFYYEFTGNCAECTYSISKCAGGFYTKAELLK